MVRRARSPRALRWCVSIPIGGGAPKVLASATSSTGFDLQRMMIDETGVYLRRSGSPEINTLIRVGGGSVVDVTTDGTLAFEVAADTIYWATLANGEVELKSMPKYAP